MGQYITSEIRSFSVRENSQLIARIVAISLITLCVLFFNLAGLIISLFLIKLFTFLFVPPKKRLESFGIIRKAPIPILTIAVSAAAAEITAQIFVNPIFEILTGRNIDLNNFYFVKNNIGFYIVMLFYSWIEGGIIEEFIFRGFLLTNIIIVLRFYLKTNSVAEYISVLIVAVIFGLMHQYQGWSGVINTGLFSILFSYVFIKSSYNLLYPILLHGFVNMTAFTIIYLDLSDKLRQILF